MQIERYRPHRSARRFDAGTPPVPNIYAGVAGVGLIAEAGVPVIQEHVRGLVARFSTGSTSSARRWLRRRAGRWSVSARRMRRARGRARRGGNRRLRTRLEPPRLAASLQHRRRRRRRALRIGAAATALL
jgi:hypothetical protein